ncbi:hypothetical protein HELRODRAFT_169629 [Helobdella robusta]|uniref:Uncharacterized protein n=1 Tax=Helobdella robusta TaxID=6412 RepID=T1F266_HELRO|nr:hypothetical protein HELRODRAFT_169629 [Helobdella robusta]ESO07923.1 hypothetical protein HELRODRAFT_169629 [Helobdella robusta]
MSSEDEQHEDMRSPPFWWEVEVNREEDRDDDDGHDDDGHDDDDQDDEDDFVVQNDDDDDFDMDEFDDDDDDDGYSSDDEHIESMREEIELRLREIERGYDLVFEAIRFGIHHEPDYHCYEF